MSFTIVEAFITLASHNFEQLVDFYRHLLNQEPPVYQPTVYAEFCLPGMKLGIFCPRKKRDEQENTEMTSPSSFGMALCLEVEDLEGAIAHLTHLNYPPVNNIITASHGREIYAYDPDGNWLILHERGEKG
ncbi:VOC family protein [Leptothermofonsia sp. ETS-13]|uniref:VOC family protein n=1 Tax=Leptothermofonsia sp. ETS-13 TaxID=3035696 RepID=UPI003B9FC6DB